MGSNVFTARLGEPIMCFSGEVGTPTSSLSHVKEQFDTLSYSSRET